MRIEAAVGGIENARTEVGELHLGHRLEVGGDRVALGILHGGGVLVDSRSQDIRSLLCIQPRLTHVPQHLVPYLGTAVHAGEGFHHQWSCRTGQCREDAIGVKLRHRRHGDAAKGEGSRHPPSEVDGGQHILSLRV
jgi:hypothetical protein